MKKKKNFRHPVPPAYRFRAGWREYPHAPIF
jgi:hypothetical protein